MAETMQKPKTGEEFVWMAARPGEWDETTHRVYEVESVDAWGVWTILYHMPPVRRVPEVFREMFGESIGKGRVERCRIAWRDGRWFAVRAHESHEPTAHGCAGCGAAPDSPEILAARCPNSRCDGCGLLVGCCACEAPHV